MKIKNNKSFIVAETALAILAVILAGVMLYGNNKPILEKIAVVVPNSDDSQWASFKYGLKMAAEDCKAETFVVNTEGAMTAKEQKSVIEQEIDNGASAVIVEPVPGADSEVILQRIGSHVPVMLAGSTASLSRQKSMLAVAEPDHFKMGKALAEELLKDYSGNIAGKTLGIVSETKKSEASANLRKGFDDGLKGKGATVLWSVAGSFKQGGAPSLAVYAKADIVVALDDTSLASAAECAQADDLHGAVIYGIGHSAEAIYYLDTDAVECLVVPDEFEMGYQSLAETVKCLHHHFRKAESRTVPFKVIRRKNLFTKENQELLFTMNQ